MKRIKSFKMFEDHVQGELIFQKDGDPIKDKPQHVQLLDALQEFADKTKFKGKFESKGKYTDYLTDDVKMKAVTTLLNLDENTIMDFYFAFFQEEFMRRFISIKEAFRGECIDEFLISKSIK